MTIPDVVRSLVERFRDQHQSYISPHYNEAQTRKEFIDPLFGALGWDMDNTQEYAEAYKDVIHEDSIKIAGDPKAPDYCFRIGGVRKFFVEAKRPAVKIATDPAASYQLRRYAWSSKLPLSVLTNFDHLALYDCRIRPNVSDAASAARIMLLDFEEFPATWDKISSILSRQAILRGSFDAFVESNKAKKGTTEVDRVFLAELDTWRATLAKNIALRNKTLSQRELNFAVQQIVDRIVFLRISEDRGTEPYGQLRSLFSTTNTYQALCTLFRRADDRYNSGLFHFKHENSQNSPPDMLTLSLSVDDAPLKHIVRRLYYPDSPYEFSQIPSVILGQIYERFLGKVIRLTAGHQAVIDDKPEVKKAGGVYYTPTHIVTHIVDSTVGHLLAGLPPERVAGSGRGKDSHAIAVVDPACGSGSFLLGAYEYLLGWYLREYLKDSGRWAKGRAPRIVESPKGWRLSMSERKNILLRHIFGVDVDSQAVEVTKLSLLLKVLEGESSQNLAQQLSFFQERALPDLANNIRCGNALIEPDMFSDKLVPLSDDVWATVNPFDWRTEFPEVFDAGGFDAVIGNPPWLMAGYYVDDDALEYLRSRFASASGKFDMYYVFIERALELIRPNGIVGMIVPNKMFHTRAARELRRILTAGSWLVDVMDFGTARVFESATNYSAIIQLSRNATAPVHVSRADANLRITEQFDIGRSALDENPWYFHPRPITKLFSTMEAAGTPLEELADRFGTGVQTGADTILTFDVAEARSEGFESDLLTPILRGRDVRRYSLTDSPRLLVFPYVEEDEWAVMPESVFKLHPVTYQFLVNHKQHLAERTWFGKTASELSGHWYGLMYLDAPSSFRSPHLLTPSLSARSNFALGTGSLFATGTAGVTSIIPKDDVREDIYYLLALLNSRLLSYYLIQHSPVYQGGYHKFSAPYLKAAPIRRINFTSVADKRQHDRLVSLAKTLIDLYSRLGGAKTPQAHVTTTRQIAACEGETDQLVYGLYGVNEDELQTIDGF